MTTTKKTAQMWGVSPERLKEQYRANLSGLERLLAKAEMRPERKTNGYTLQELREVVAKYRKLAA